ncbi:hypothetical protein LGH82_28455 [Mesorhizobium sp. PAMC28654]|uniref:hypothetical protein n=1 Tax=Mesorhizobium sp. PAMC28654 TaxID=2880934 RepID=UPI001D0A3642|nr:hypothetical protein [Mesorhizobium sp. PAMC28654]UDL88986.1 hypothetical protein LGH82_28455 [Mesorhizobium sp. PAMC28654]
MIFLPFSLAGFERHRQTGDRIAASLTIALEFFPRYFRPVEFCFWIVLVTKSQQGGFAASIASFPANGAGLRALKEK